MASNSGINTIDNIAWQCTIVSRRCAIYIKFFAFHVACQLTKTIGKTIVKSGLTKLFSVRIARTRWIFWSANFYTSSPSHCARIDTIQLTIFILTARNQTLCNALFLNKIASFFTSQIALLFITGDQWRNACATNAIDDFCNIGLKCIVACCGAFCKRSCTVLYVQCTIDTHLDTSLKFRNTRSKTIGVIWEDRVTSVCTCQRRIVANFFAWFWGCRCGWWSWCSAWWATQSVQNEMALAFKWARCVQRRFRLAISIQTRIA